MSDNTLASYQCQVLPLELIWKLLPSVMYYITHVLCCVVLCCVVLYLYVYKCTLCNVGGCMKKGNHYTCTMELLA